MENAIYATLTRQSGLMAEMRVVANNIANANTTGFRREGVIFAEHLSALDRNGDTLSMANARGRLVDLDQGVLTQTGGNYDLVIEGDGFFLIETPDGNRLTRLLRQAGDRFNHGFERMGEAYARLTRRLVAAPRRMMLAYAALIGVTVGVFALTPSQAAGLQAVFDTSLRVGLDASASDATGGFETFFVANSATVTPIPEPSTWALLLGGLDARQPAELRAAFAAGASLASAMWFGLLGFGAAAAAPWLQSATTWRILDALVALLMGGLGLQLLLQPL